MKVPTWLNNTAKEYWKKLSPLLRDERHCDLLAQLCQCYQDYHDARENISTNGQTVKSGDRLFVNPAVAVKNEADKQIVRLLKALKLPPFDDTETAVKGDWGQLLDDDE